MEPESSGEHPKMLGGGFNARVEDRSHPKLATLQRASKGSTFVKTAGELPKGF